ncbi:hypothetical protein M8J76_013909 [Diaphorina citri]|nr:hypothetical protein M8J76_013909 [Diaphorina citri]
MIHKRKLVLIVVGIFLYLCLFTDFLSIPPNTSNQEDQFSLLLSQGLTSSDSTWQSSSDLLPPDDSTRLINLTNFEFLINPPCLDTVYLVLIHSAPYNYDKRRLIRNTWGTRVSVYFFIGETDPSNQTRLDIESETYHDIVQGRFWDSYRNLTYKHTMVFKWVVYNCPHVKYVFKLDDDVFMNVIQLDELLTRTLSPHGTRNLLMCPIVWEKLPVLRTYRSKWRVSFSEYRDHFYPPHCHGNILLYSPDVVFKLYQHLQTDQEYFWVDDVFITGIVFSKLNLTHAKFSWWPGHDEPVVILYSKMDLQQYDPHKTLFAYLWEKDYVFKYKYMYIATYLNTSLLES